MRSTYNPLGATDMAKDYIIDYGSNSNGWWRKWKSGFIEQGGKGVGDSGGIVNTLPISFSNTDYIIVSQPISTGGYWGTPSMVTIASENQFTLGAYGGTGLHMFWYACGY